MAQTTAIKGRIKAVKNTRQITKAMELVAASKMRRAQEAALKTRDYYNLAQTILTRLRQLTDVSKHPLYRQRKIRDHLYVFITSDRGLAGAYNSNLYKRLAAELINDKTKGIKSRLIVVGKQGSHFIVRFKDVEIIAAYHNLPERPTANDIRPILNTIIQQFTTKETDVVDIIYTHYASSINQVVSQTRLLPAAFQEVKLTPDLGDAIFEPSPQEVLDNVTERLLDAQLSQAFLESLASEHSMRMLAMKNATDNASDLIDDLTLAFNTARQAAITQELAEITGGAEAISA